MVVEDTALSPTSGNPDGDARARRVKGYESARPDVQAVVPLGARRILELGCSAGALGAALKARDGASVVGVELDPVYAQLAEQRLDRVVCADAEVFLSEGMADRDAPFDCLIAADVLEHLVDPWGALSAAVDLLEPGANVVISVPNVLYLPGLLKLIWRGRWPRADEGTFDRTHLRWFTMIDAVELLESAGLGVELVSPTYALEGLRLACAKGLARSPMRRFVAYQWIVRGQKP